MRLSIRVRPGASRTRVGGCYGAGEDAVLTRQMADYLATLPEPQQQVVRGIYLQEFSQQELADRLGVPLGTIKSRLRLALQKLKEQVEQGHD